MTGQASFPSKIDAESGLEQAYVQSLLRLFRAERDTSGNLPPLADVFPDTLAPVVSTGKDGVRELRMMRWGFPPPPKIPVHQRLGAGSPAVCPDERTTRGRNRSARAHRIISNGTPPAIRWQYTAGVSTL